MIHIIQLLCPARHCVLASAFDAEKISPDEAMQEFQRIVGRCFETGAFNPWCGICHCRELVYEEGKTRFKTMEEAQPFLEENQRQQRAAAAILGQHGRN